MSQNNNIDPHRPRYDNVEVPVVLEPPAANPNNENYNPSSDSESSESVCSQNTDDEEPTLTVGTLVWAKHGVKEYEAVIENTNGRFFLIRWTEWNNPPWDRPIWLHYSEIRPVLALYGLMLVLEHVRVYLVEIFLIVSEFV